LEVRASDAVEFHATGGGAFRAPDFTELYGNQGGIIGNPGLRPEQGVFAELGASLRSEALTFQVDTHWTRRRDLIVYVLNAQRVAIAQNLGVTRVQGVEAAVVTAPTVWMDLQANVTWSNSSNRDPDPAYFGNKVPGLPAFELHLRPSLHHRELLRTGYSMDWSTPTFWDATNWHRSTHRLFHGAWLRYQPVLAFPSLEISALNITNRRSEEVPRDPLFINGDTVRQPVTDLLGYPLPGRTLWLTLRWQR
jgi:outer membrane receptor protein involved in Fe transport